MAACKGRDGGCRYALKGGGAQDLGNGLAIRLLFPEILATYQAHLRELFCKMHFLRTNHRPGRNNKSMIYQDSEKQPKSIFGIFGVFVSQRFWSRICAIVCPCVGCVRPSDIIIIHVHVDQRDDGRLEERLHQSSCSGPLYFTHPWITCQKMFSFGRTITTPRRCPKFLPCAVEPFCRERKCYVPTNSGCGGGSFFVVVEGHRSGSHAARQMCCGSP